MRPNSPEPSVRSRDSLLARLARAGTSPRPRGVSRNRRPHWTARLAARVAEPLRPSMGPHDRRLRLPRAARPRRGDVRRLARPGIVAHLAPRTGARRRATPWLAPLSAFSSSRRSAGQVPCYASAA